MSFDRLAPHYTWMERVLAGGRLQAMRIHWLAELPSARRALLVGEGHGRFLPELRRRMPDTEVVAVDASSAMLGIARRRLEESGAGLNRVWFVQAHLPELPAGLGDFDLIVTQFFLDCFPPDELMRVVNALGRAASADAHWMNADFCCPPRGFARLRSRCILALMYAFFRPVVRLPATSLTSPDPLLIRTGFTLHCRHHAEWGLLHSDWWRQTGPSATRAGQDCMPSPTSRY